VYKLHDTQVAQMAVKNVRNLLTWLENYLAYYVVSSYWHTGFMNSVQRTEMIVHLL